MASGAVPSAKLLTLLWRTAMEEEVSKLGLVVEDSVHHFCSQMVCEDAGNEVAKFFLLLVRGHPPHQHLTVRLQYQLFLQELTSKGVFSLWEELSVMLW